ncbi:MAG: aminotransferase class V-fold PLP-dependent enzyme [Clostridia bacterium]|nr:aminotransferase class V-fold PLP-dependent enzyme [Clostridia bacterium]
MIYLDNAATSAQKPQAVYRAMWDMMTQNGASPGRGGYKSALRAAETVYEAREKLADFFHAEDPARIIFTQNTTHALNLAICGYLSYGAHVIYSSMEHNSVVRPIKTLEKQRRISSSVLKADENGTWNPNALPSLIRPNTRLICLTHSSNVCGAISDIYAAADVAKKHGVRILIDAAQSAGTLPIDASKFDFVAFPGHKGLLGPAGTGGLYMGKDIELSPLITGGTGSMSESLLQPEILPDRYESGTQNAPAIAGLSAALSFLSEVGIDTVRKHEEALRKKFDEAMQSIPDVTLYGNPNKTAISAINICGLDANTAAELLDTRYGICVRSGLHCAPLAHKTLGTAGTGAIRFSFGLFNTEREISRAIDAVYALSREFVNKP